MYCLKCRRFYFFDQVLYYLINYPNIFYNSYLSQCSFILGIFQIDGNPFAFSLPSNAGGESQLRKLNRKDWKKLKKNDIQHSFNRGLSDTENAVMVVDRYSIPQRPTMSTLVRNSQMSNLVAATATSPSPSARTIPAERKGVRFARDSQRSPVCAPSSVSLRTSDKTLQCEVTPISSEVRLQEGSPDKGAENHVLPSDSENT